MIAIKHRHAPEVSDQTTLKVAYLFSDYPVITHEPFYQRIALLGARCIDTSLYYYFDTIAALGDEQANKDLIERNKALGIPLTQMPSARHKGRAVWGLLWMIIFESKAKIAFDYLLNSITKGYGVKKSIGWLSMIYPVIFQQPNIVQIENSFLIRGLFKPLEMSRIPVVVALVGGDVDTKPGMNQRWQELFCESFKYEFIYFQCVSNHVRNKVVELGANPDRAIVIRRSAIVTNLDLELSSDRAQSCSRSQLIVISRLWPEKGVDLSLLALSQLAKQGVNCHLHIIGYGPERQRLVEDCDKMNLNDRVTFHGIKSHADTVSILLSHRNDGIFVQPSRRDGMPKTVIEAMAIGLPIVAARVGGIPELITDGETGLLHQPDSVDSLVKKLEQVISDPIFADQMGKRAFLRARDEFSIEREIEDFLQLYRHIICTEPFNEMHITR